MLKFIAVWLIGLTTLWLPQEAVRETMRRWRAYGASEADQIRYGRLAAKSGLKTVPTENIPGNKDGRSALGVDKSSQKGYNISNIKASRELKKDTVYEKETEVYETRKETRDEFIRAAYEENCTVDERGQIAYAYKVCRSVTENAQKTKEELGKFGIKGIIHEGLKSNFNSTTTIYNSDASTYPGVCVFIDNEIDRSPVETAGHEAFHYWWSISERNDLVDIIADNINFSSREFIAFENEIEKDYFDKEVEIDDDSWYGLNEEIYAYIVGHVYSGDVENIVRPFIRDYGEVEAAVDSFFASQQGKDSRELNTLGNEFANENAEYFKDSNVSSDTRYALSGEDLRQVAWFDGRNTVYIKADGSNADIYSALLGHEVFHKMFKSSKVKKLFMEAWNNTPEAKRTEVTQAYMAHLKENTDLGIAERVNISNEEVAAAYAQELFNSPDVWDFILEGEPSLADRIIKFFGGVPKRYSFAKGMDAAAKRWLNHYQKLFNEVAELNKGAAALQNAGFGIRNSEFESEGRASLKDIVGESGTKYGIGVYLDSTLLSGLNENERIQMVKEYVKELGGKSFTAYDKNHKNVDVYIAEANQKFKNQSGKSVPVNKDLTSYLRKTVKQESIALIDELIVTSTLQSKKDSQYSHDWLDNYGKNDWEYWTTYIQDKENAIWEATLNIVTTANGERILYDIVPIKKVEQSVTSDTSTTTHSIYNSAQNVNTSGKKTSKNADSGGRSALVIGKKATASEVKTLKGEISDMGIEPGGIVALADSYFDRYGGDMNRTTMRQSMLEAARGMLDSL